MSHPDSVASTLELDERYGWMYEKRIAALDSEYQKVERATKAPTFQVPVKGSTEHIPIVKVPIGLPKYRLNNGRTRNSQLEHLAKNKELDKELFRRDPEVISAQKAQHEILLTHADEEQLRDHLKEVNQLQDEPIVLSFEGFVLNGNRRLSVWRSLYYTDPVKYKHLEYIQIVRLEELNESELLAVERRLQTRRGHKADYDWHARAQMIKDSRDFEDMSPKELVSEYGLDSTNDISEFIDALKLAREYLESRDKTDQWSTLNKSEYGFRGLVQNSKNLSDTDQRLLKELTFALIAESDTNSKGSTYRKIRDFKKNLETIKASINEELGSDIEPSSPTASGPWDDILGPATPSNPQDQLLDQILDDKTNRQDVLDIAQDALTSQAALKRERDHADYLIKLAADANAALTNLENSLSTSRKTNGLSKQLDALEKRIQLIRQWLKINAAD